MMVSSERAWILPVQVYIVGLMRGQYYKANDYNKVFYTKKSTSAKIGYIDKELKRYLLDEHTSRSQKKWPSMLADPKRSVSTFVACSKSTPAHHHLNPRWSAKTQCGKTLA